MFIVYGLRITHAATRTRTRMRRRRPEWQAPRRYGGVLPRILPSQRKKLPAVIGTLSSSPARRRSSRSTGIAAAVELLRRRRTDAARLAELRASGALCGLEGCEEPTGALRPGAVVLALPAPPGTQPLAVAGLLDARGLALLASDDVLARYADLVSH